MNKIAFVEFSNKIVDKERNVLDILNREHFYNKSKELGYRKTDDFTEFPQWSNYIASLFPSHDKELIICKDVNETTDLLNEEHFEYVFFSAIEATRELIMMITKGLKNDYSKFIIGNGIGTHMRTRNSTKKNVFIYDSIVEFAKVHTISMTNIYPRSYTGIEEKFNPRIYTTRGCKNNCAFCENDGKFYNIPISEYRDYGSIVYENDLVYVGNKTFLQGGKDELKSLDYFSKADGFIVQTSALTLLRNINRLHNLRAYNVKVVEIGIETFNEDVLVKLGKPFISHSDLGIVVNMLKSYGIKVIFNIMLGIPEDNNVGYIQTMNNLNCFASDIYALNITNYSDYSSTNAVDRDERHLISKSWITDVVNLSAFQSDIYKFNYELLNK